jgi:protease I
MEQLDKTQRLNGKRVAILVADGFEQVEMTEPRQALVDAGADTDLIAPVAGLVKGWNNDNWGEDFEVDVLLAEADAAGYDALLIPGGVMSPDELRMDKTAVQFVKDFFSARKPVASICHGPWLLVEADVVKGRAVTSYRSLRRDLENAGADWVDGKAVIDDNLVTSRNPGDIPAFNEKMISVFGGGEQEGAAA